MRSKTLYSYYELLPNGTFCSQVVNQPLPTYPRSLRFKRYEDMVYYTRAKAAFIRSTIIPTGCDKCPTEGLCGRFHGTIMCRKMWRKIWEYVK